MEQEGLVMSRKHLHSNSIQAYISGKSWYKRKYKRKEGLAISP